MLGWGEGLGDGNIAIAGLKLVWGKSLELNSKETPHLL